MRGMTAWDDDEMPVADSRPGGAHRPVGGVGPDPANGKDDGGDGDCPWCRALLGPGRVPGGAGAEKPGHLWSSAWMERLRMVMVPVATATVAAAVVATLY
ncbi:hypothetical protein ACFYOV_23805 [Streptomyces sp. NPDC005931]|uniref:hypothetical protein n=1 Tax=Streptomyces sp. NPDC005931 TaxID=3364737 RepID=UPI0036B00309